MHSNTFKDIIKNYKWNSLFNEYFKKFVLIIFVPVAILNAIIYFLYYNNNTNLLKHNIESGFNMLYNSVDLSFSTAIQLFEQYTNDYQLNNFLISEEYDFNFYESNDQLFSLSQALSNQIYNSNDFEYITVYSYINNYTFSTDHGYTPLTYFSRRELIEKIKDFPINNFASITLLPDENPSLVHVIKTINYAGKPISIFIITVNVNRILSSVKYSSFDDIFITYGDTVIYSMNPDYDKDKLFGIYENSYDYMKNRKKFNPHRNTSVHAELSNYFDVNITAKFSGTSVNNILLQSIVLLVICIILAILIPVIMSFYISMQYYQSIAKITMELQNALLDNTPIHKTDEINYISSNITYMATKLRNVEEELTEKLLSLKKSQIKILQNQINPHFIFNTLNSINLYLQNYLDEDCAPVVMISSLSDMLSELLSIGEYTTSIQKEIEYTKKYIEIELIKHLDRFEVNWDIDESLLKYHTVKMILQPVIENALDYGIYPLPKTQKGCLTISVKDKNNDIEFCISDNGVGIEREKLHQLSHDLLNSELPDTKHIGLLNINMRIKTIYNEKYGVKVFSGSNGTTVILLIPKTSE